MRSFSGRCGRSERVIAAFTVALALSPRAAHANGRYPLSQQIVVDPGDSNRLWLRATYGLLTSADAGKTWDWICESAIGISAQEDPQLGVAKSGTVYLGAAEGILETADHGCTWTRNTDTGDRFVRDIAVEGDGAHVLALTTTTLANRNYDLEVFRSDADGAHFASLGTASLDLVAVTLDPAPSDASRLYVTGQIWPTAPAADAGSPLPDGGHRTPSVVGVLLRSKDGGKTWDRRIIPGTAVDVSGYIAAVHPTNPDVVFIRTHDVSSGSGGVQSSLLYTEDGGDHFRELFRGSADMLGFALASDGNEVFIGLGGSLDPKTAREVDPASIGVYSASAPDFSFARGLKGQVGCLTRFGTSLLVCGGHDSEGFEVGTSSDDGTTVTPILDLQGVRGVLACPASSRTTTACTSEWESICPQLGSRCGVSSKDGGTKAPAAKAEPKNGGCACSSPRSAKSTDAGKVGMTRLGMLPDAPGTWTFVAVVAWLARRRGRPKA